MPRLDMEKVSRIDLLGKRFRTLVLLVFGALSVRRVEEVRLVPCSIASYTAVALSIPPDTRITALLLLMIAQLRRIDFRSVHHADCDAPIALGVPHYLDQTGPVQRSCSRGVVPQVNVEARRVPVAVLHR